VEDGMLWVVLVIGGPWVMAAMRLENTGLTEKVSSPTDLVGARAWAEGGYILRSQCGQKTVAGGRGVGPRTLVFNLLGGTQSV
jgi:hypothetical protein